MRIKNIVVIDDDENIRDIFKFALQLKGYTVYSAANGLEGLAILKRIPRPSLVFVDLMMPVMDGWELMKKVKSDAELAENPMVVISAFDVGRQPVTADLVLKKPVELDQLFLTVNEFYCIEQDMVH